MLAHGSGMLTIGNGMPWLHAKPGMLIGGSGWPAACYR